LTYATEMVATARKDASKTPRSPFASDGRSVTVALDHPLALGQAAGLEDPRGVLTAISAAGADAAILTPGTAAMLATLDVALPWLLTADYYATSTDPGAKGEDEMHGMLWSGEHAARLGASGVKCLWVHGQRDAEQHVGALRALARLIESAHRHDLPVMVESVLWGARLAADDADSYRVANAARMAFELGADIIKVAMPHDITPLAKVASAIDVPIVAMGGAARDPEGLFTSIHTALDGGLRGVALGRNVWSAPDVASMVRALRALVHDDATVAESLAILRDGSPA